MKEVYSDCKNSYIKKEGTGGRPFWQIVANRFRVMED